MAPLEKGDDSFQEQYMSMFSIDVNGKNGKKGGLPTVHSENNFGALNNGANSVTNSEGISKKRQAAPNASGDAVENSFEK